MRRGDIYYVKLPSKNGSVQAGIRPVIIVQNDIGNYYSPTTIVCSITSTHKKRVLPTHLPIPKNGGLKKQSMILGEQIFTINKKDLLQYVGTIRDKHILKELDECIRMSLGLTDNKEE